MPTEVNKLGFLYFAKGASSTLFNFQQKLIKVLRQPRGCTFQIFNCRNIIDQGLQLLYSDIHHHICTKITLATSYSQPLTRCGKQSCSQETGFPRETTLGQECPRGLPEHFLSHTIVKDTSTQQSLLFHLLDLHDSPMTLPNSSPFCSHMGISP